MQNWEKDFQDLTLADDYMFSEVMRQPKCCKPFLEALLEKKIAKIVAVDKQKDLSDTYDSHGIRLDVYLEDDAGTKYDVEMQTTTQKSLEKRIRYYQSGIDRHMLDRGEDYRYLRNSYVIFICLHDYFKRGLALYERESHIKGAPDVVYDDGSRAIILNANFTTGNADSEIINFLNYVKNTYEGREFDVSGSPYLTKIDETIKEIKRDNGKERQYMTFAAKMRDTYYEGEENGARNNLIKIIKHMLSSGTEAVEISKTIGEPLDVVEEIVAEIESEKA